MASEEQDETAKASSLILAAFNKGPSTKACPGGFIQRMPTKNDRGIRPS